MLLVVALSNVIEIRPMSYNVFSSHKWPECWGKEKLTRRQNPNQLRALVDYALRLCLKVSSFTTG